MRLQIARLKPRWFISYINIYAMQWRIQDCFKGGYSIHVSKMLFSANYMAANRAISCTLCGDLNKILFLFLLLPLFPLPFYVVPFVNGGVPLHPRPHITGHGKFRGMGNSTCWPIWYMPRLRECAEILWWAGLGNWHFRCLNFFDPPFTNW